MRSVFYRMLERNVISWNAILGAYEQNGLGKEIFRLFEQMQGEAIAPVKVTFVTILSACAGHSVLAASAGMTALNKGQQIHPRVMQSGWYSDLDVVNGLINMYGRLCRTWV